MIERMRLVAVLALACAALNAADAQIIGPRIGRSPAAFASLGIGWLRQQGFCDKATGDCWAFGSGPQWRASFELPVGYGGTTFGVVGTTARMPLIYRGSGLGSSCLGCDADANITQILGLLRLGGSEGLHQVIDVAAGATLFSNFRATDGTRIGPAGTTSRFTFAIAYGFGYGLSPRSEIFLEQEYGLIILPRMAGSNTNTAQQSTIRIGGRIGLGDKRY